MTGCGKSCILCSLSNKTLLVKGESKFMHLEGEGVGHGLKSFTSIPMFEKGKIIKQILIDCPGFNDVRGYMTEILNAFSMDNIFETYEGHENKFKIVLVVSQGEFSSTKGTAVIDSLLRLEEMFPIGTSLRDNIGLIVTKGSTEYEGFDYIDELNNDIKLTENPDEKIVAMCQSLLSHRDHIFTFPRPSRKDKDMPYEFDDHDNLLNFLDNDYLINPKHKIALSAEAKLRLRIVRDDHSKKLANKIKLLCDKIYEQFSHESQSIELKKWYDIIFKLFRSNIKEANELNAFLQEHVPNSEQYKEYIDEIAEYELFDKFIDKIIFSSINTSCLYEVIQAWCKNAVNQLHQYVINAINSEKTKDKIESLEKLKKESDKIIQDFQKLLKKIDAEKAKIEEEYKARIKKLEESHNKNENELNRLNEQYQLLKEQQLERERNIQKAQYNQAPQIIVKEVPKVEYVYRDAPSKSGGCLLI